MNTVEIVRKAGGFACYLVGATVTECIKYAVRSGYEVVRCF